MKKLICLLLTAALLTGLLQGCANNAAEPATEPSEAPTVTTAPTTAPAATTEETHAAAETTVPEEDGHLRLKELKMESKGTTYRLYSSNDMEGVTFGSDNEAVATFEKGIVVCQGEGTATVYAERSGQRQECTVICVFPTQAPTTEPTTEATEPETEPETEAATEATQATEEAAQATTEAVEETTQETTQETTEETTEATTEPELNIPSGGSRDPVMAPPTSYNVDSSFFDDACFIGDSVSVMLSWHAGDTGCLGNAKFLTKESYSAVNASYNYMTMEYNGVSYDHIEDAVAATGANKCFIMLGTNDIGYRYISDTIEDWKDIVDRIREKNPGIQIYIQSGTPIYTGGEVGSLNNDEMDALNVELEAFAAREGCRYLNVAQYLKDSTNGLADCYCSDGYVHLTYTGADVWVRALKALI